jgi:hypothetical protein
MNNPDLAPVSVFLITLQDELLSMGLVRLGQEMGPDEEL